MASTTLHPMLSIANLPAATRLHALLMRVDCSHALAAWFEDDLCPAMPCLSGKDRSMLLDAWAPIKMAFDRHAKFTMLLKDGVDC